MKVAFDLTENRNFRDGVTHYATEVIRRLAASGEREYVGEAFLSYKDGKGAMREHFSSLTPGLPLHLKKTIFPMRILLRLIRKKSLFSYDAWMGERADVRIFFHNFLPAMRMKGKKIVFIHDLTPLNDPDTGKRQLARLDAACRRTVECADLIFTVSEYSRADIVRHYPAAEGKIVVCPCGVDFKWFSKPVPKERLHAVLEKYGISGGYLLFMGQARKNKNLENLLRGYALLPEEVRARYALVLANHTEGQAALARDLGIEGRTVLLDGVESDDVAPLYHAARGLALVSFSEGFGMPLVEAMAAGIPTVASDSTCLPEIVGDASRLVKADDPASIAEGLLAVLTDERLRETLISRGESRARLYDWDEAARRLDCGIRRVAEGT